VRKVTPNAGINVVLRPRPKTPACRVRTRSDSVGFAPTHWIGSRLTHLILNRPLGAARCAGYPAPHSKTRGSYVNDPPFQQIDTVAPDLCAPRNAQRACAPPCSTSTERLLSVHLRYHLSSIAPVRFFLAMSRAKLLSPGFRHAQSGKSCRHPVTCTADPGYAERNDDRHENKTVSSGSDNKVPAERQTNMIRSLTKRGLFISASDAPLPLSRQFAAARRLRGS